MFRSISFYNKDMVQVRKVKLLLTNVDSVCPKAVPGPPLHISRPVDCLFDSNNNISVSYKFALSYHLMSIFTDILNLKIEITSLLFIVNYAPWRRHEDSLCGPHCAALIAKLAVNSQVEF